ncbi:hypothetical protein ABW20_dc0106265 [Dactylellina cionopaga]|nr:hypothetical protein ABW20_dc0106265 [Dactylellina cionopaga]
MEITNPDGQVEISALPWNAFLGYLSAPRNHRDSPSIYLAQQSPPSFLLDDIPPPFRHLGFTIREKQQNLSTTTPSGSDNSTFLVDIYSSSLWFSRSSPATTTPLHRDPNDNLFVQLASEKVIRCIPPNIGDALFRYLSAEGKIGSIDPRGRIRDDLLNREETSILDAIIWGDDKGANGDDTFMTTFVMACIYQE